MKAPTEMDHSAEPVTIRRLGDADLRELVLLAGRDTQPLPTGPVLGAEVGGRIVAATSLVTGETVADPFAPTAEIRAMLELRAAQLRRPRRRGRGLRLKLRTRPRAALGASPPGAGGRLLTLGSR